MKEHVEKLVVVSSSGIQDWHANCQTPTRIEFVSQRHIEEIDGIHDFRVQRGTLSLLFCADKVAVRVLMSISDRDSPMMSGKRPAFVRRLS